MTDMQQVDANLLRKNNSVFHARRIQFKESYRVDLKQEGLRQKYRPVNLPNSASPSSPSGITTTPSSATYSGGKAGVNTVTEDENGFRLPAKALFSKEKVQLAWPQPRPIGPGLDNLGNTCFLNSVLQCLTYTPPLANFLLSNQHSNSCKTNNFCMMCLLERHVSQCFDHSMNESISPKVIVGRLKNIGKQFTVGRQEDSHEFVRCLIDSLQKSSLVGFDSKLDNRIKETTIIHQIFGGYFQSQVKCTVCEQESNTFEPFLDISLDIKGTESIQRALRDYTRPEILTKSNQYQCDKCKELVNAKKQMTIYEAPKVLTVHLKRFTSSGQKINQHIKFDTKLELASSSNGIWYSMNDTNVAVISLQTVLSQNAYMLFYTQDKPALSKSTTNTSIIRPTQVRTPVATIKRPKLDGDETGAKVERSSIVIKEKKKAKVEQPTQAPELTKEERIRLKKEKKRAQQLEQLKREAEKESQEGTETKATSSSSTPSTLSSITTEEKPVEVNFAQRRPSLTLPIRPLADWKVEGAPKSPVAKEHGTLDLNDQKKKREYHDMEAEQDEEEEPVLEKEGEWTVKPRTVTEAIVVSHNEASTSKREKLQALIARESEFKSAEVKDAILGEVKHMLGSKVSTWEEPSYELTKAREAVLKTLKPKHHRPDAYDVEYDRGKVKKVKIKNVMDGEAVGAKVGNKFQKEQDVRNLVKPKFNKNKNTGGKKPKSEL
ncbi:hypothetical protein BG006_009148 [Podila minutissima]|uniref:ubiquitinyl hydrolase 1 n=1 Tax=Podila minutissima TaxID=64525 RepID=A0A9P5SHS8_9FUNG|nr:hypothetical protein BG006_009148 [Podila minutissima]